MPLWDTRKYVDHLLVNTTVGRHNIAFVDVDGIPFKVSDKTTRLLHKQDTGGQIPGVQPPFPETIVAAGGHIGQVQRGRAPAPHACATWQQARQILFDALELEADIVSLKRQYTRDFQKVLGPRAALRFYQIENKLDAVINFELASVVPLRE